VQGIVSSPVRTHETINKEKGVKKC
jgi:hypothetical protein